MFQAETPPEELIQEFADTLGNQPANAGLMPEFVPPEDEEEFELRRRRPPNG